MSNTSLPPPISIPGHSILPLTRADIPKLASFVQASKLHLAINRFLYKDWPNEAAQHEHILKTVTQNFDNRQVTRVKVVDNATGDMVAHLVLTRLIYEEGTDEEGEEEGEQEDEVEEVDSVRPKAPDAMDPKVFDAVMQAMEYINEGWGDVNRIELTHIYVDPASRGKGIGSQLVRFAAQLAGAEGAPLTVAVEPQAHRFFLGLGLLDTRHFDIDLSRWAPEYCGYGLFRIWGMKMDFGTYRRSFTR